LKHTNVAISQGEWQPRRLAKGVCLKGGSPKFQFYLLLKNICLLSFKINLMYSILCTEIVINIIIN